MSVIECTSTRSRIQRLANNSEIENSRNKSHAKISELTVIPKNFKLLAISCDCTAWFVSAMVGDPEVLFSRIEAHMIESYPDQRLILFSVISARSAWTELGTPRRQSRPRQTCSSGENNLNSSKCLQLELNFTLRKHAHVIYKFFISSKIENL